MGCLSPGCGGALFPAKLLWARKKDGFLKVLSPQTSKNHVRFFMRWLNSRVAPQEKMEMDVKSHILFRSGRKRATTPGPMWSKDGKTDLVFCGLGCQNLREYETFGSQLNNPAVGSKSHKPWLRNLFSACGADAMGDAVPLSFTSTSLPNKPPAPQHRENGGGMI